MLTWLFVIVVADKCAAKVAAKFRALHFDVETSPFTGRDERTDDEYYEDEQKKKKESRR